MKLIKASEMKDAVVSFAFNYIESHRNEYFLEKFVHLIDINNGYIHENLMVAVERDTIIDFVFERSLLGCTLISPDFLSEHQKVIDTIREHYGDDILINGESIALTRLFPCNLKSSLTDAVYHLNSGYFPIYCFKEENVDMLRDAMEREYFGAELGELHFQVMTKGELFDYLYDEQQYSIPTWRTNNGWSHVAGFHYLELEWGNASSKYLCALSNGKVVGCIKYSIFQDTYGLEYIDVAMPYRKKGIATKMIAELARILDDKYPLVLSDESDMGKKCHIHDHFKACKWNTDVYIENRITHQYEKIA